MFQSDANRGLAEECGATLPTITIMDAADEEGVLVQVKENGRTRTHHAGRVWGVEGPSEKQAGG